MKIGRNLCYFIRFVCKVPSTPVYVPDMHMMVPPVTTVPSGPTNVRQKIAPANAALIQSMRVRDPRLLRQPTSISGQNTSQLLPTDHMYNHKSISEANGPRKFHISNKKKKIHWPIQLGSSK